GGLGGFWNGLLEQQAGIVHVRTEGGGFLAVFFAVSGNIVFGHSLRWVGVGDFRQDQHQAGGQNGAFDLFSSQRQEGRQRGTVGLVELALVALFDQGGFGQHGG